MLILLNYCSTTRAKENYIFGRCKIADLMIASLKSKEYSRLFRSEEHTSELQSRFDLVCRLLLDPPHSSYLHSFPTRRSSDLHFYALSRRFEKDEREVSFYERC